MIVLALSALSLAQGQPISFDPSIRQEIVVIGGKLKKWTAHYEVRGNRSLCRTKKSSGDSDVDTIGCDAFNQCLAPLQPRIDASDSTSITVPARKAMKVSIKADLSTCVTQRRDQLIAALAERRYQALQGQPN